MSARKQFVSAHAQMLKVLHFCQDILCSGATESWIVSYLQWQHSYLQTAILKELSTSSVTATPNPLYSVLRKHRHAISEPSNCGNFAFDRRPNSTTGQLAVDTETKNISHHEESVNLGQDDKCERTNVQNRSFRQRNLASSDRTACNAENELLNYSNMHSNSTVGKSRLNNTDTSASNEADSPSEGYHSQQSSGSPTPSSERSSVHFSEESQLSNSTAPSCSGCVSLCAVGSCKTVLSKGVDVWLISIRYTRPLFMLSASTLPNLATLSGFSGGLETFQMKIEFTVLYDCQYCINFGYIFHSYCTAFFNKVYRSINNLHYKRVRVSPWKLGYSNLLCIWDLRIKEPAVTSFVTANWS